MYCSNDVVVWDLGFWASGLGFRFRARRADLNEGLMAQGFGV